MRINPTTDRVLKRRRVENTFSAKPSGSFGLNSAGQKRIIVNGRELYGTSWAELVKSCPHYRTGGHCDNPTCNADLSTNASAVVWHAEPQGGECGGFDLCAKCATSIC